MVLYWLHYYQENTAENKTLLLNLVTVKERKKTTNYRFNGTSEHFALNKKLIETNRTYHRKAVFAETASWTELKQWQAGKKLQWAGKKEHKDKSDEKYGTSELWYWDALKPLLYLFENCSSQKIPPIISGRTIPSIEMWFCFAINSMVDTLWNHASWLSQICQYTQFL